MHSKKDTFVVEVMDYQHMTKDRSLGVTELSVADLFHEGPDKKLKPWTSTGKRSRKESLKTDGKKTVKGQIDYDVEFFPCAHLKNVSFNEPESDTIKEDDESMQTAVSSVATNGVNGINGVNGKTTDADEDEGITIPRDELIKTQTGILVFQIIGGALSRKGARLEVLFDDGYWPACSSLAPARQSFSR